MKSEDTDPLSDLPWPGPVEPRADVSSAIRRRCTEGLCARRRLSALQRLIISLSISTGLIVLLITLGATHGGRHTVLSGALFGALGWSIVQAVILFLGLTTPPGRRVSRIARLSLLFAVPIGFVIYLVATGGGAAPFAEVTHGAQGAWVLGCGAFALVFGALASIGMLLVWRGTDPLTPGLSGAIAGMAGGLASASAMGCACPATETWHLVLSHGSILVLLGLAGWAIGRRWLAP